MKKGRTQPRGKKRRKKSKKLCTVARLQYFVCLILISSVALNIYLVEDATRTTNRNNPDVTDAVQSTESRTVEQGAAHLRGASDVVHVDKLGQPNKVAAATKPAELAKPTVSAETPAAVAAALVPAVTAAPMLAVASTPVASQAAPAVLLALAESKICGFDRYHNLNVENPAGYEVRWLCQMNRNRS